MLAQLFNVGKAIEDGDDMCSQSGSGGYNLFDNDVCRGAVMSCNVACF